MKCSPLSGLQFERLTALELDGRDRQGRAVWRCSCICGASKHVPARHLVSGRIRSCGCLAREVAAEHGRRGAAKLRGSQSHLYKPELTDEEREVGRDTARVREWRALVFRRADFRCDLCGVRGQKVSAHHLDCWSKFRERRFDPDNGVCLCVPHHKAFHEWMGGPRKPCTSADYYAFRKIERLKAGGIVFAGAQVAVAVEDASRGKP